MPHKRYIFIKRFPRQEEIFRVYLLEDPSKVKVIPQQVEVAQRVPGSLRTRNFLTFGATRVVGRQPYAPAAFTSGEIPGTHF